MVINLSIGLLWLVAIIQGAIIIALVHQLAELRVIANSGTPALPQLPIGAPAPEFSANELRSNRSLSSSSFGGRRTVLCFMNADCQVCRSLAFDLSQKPAEALAGLVIYYDGVGDSVSAVFLALADRVPVLCKGATDVSTQFGVDKFPVAILIDEASRIAGTTHPLRADDLLASLTRQAEQAGPTSSELPTLAGQS